MLVRKLTFQIGFGTIQMLAIRLAQCMPGAMDIPCLLQIHPEGSAGTKINPQPQGSIWRNGAMTAYQLIHAPARNTQTSGESFLGYLQRLQETGLQKEPWQERAARHVRRRRRA